MTRVAGQRAKGSPWVWRLTQAEWMSGARLSECVCAFLRSKGSEVFARVTMRSSNVRLCQVYIKEKKVGRMSLFYPVNGIFVFRTKQNKKNPGQVESAHIARIRVNHSHWMTDVHRLAPWRAPSRLTGWGTRSFYRKRITGSSFFAGGTSEAFLLCDGCYFWMTPKLYDHLHSGPFIVRVWN